MTILSTFLYTFIQVHVIFGVLSFFFHVIGISIVITLLNSKPILINVLPFIAHHIFIFHRGSGIMTFDHRWSTFELENGLVSSILLALQKFSEETLRIGDIYEIKLKFGVLMMRHGNNFTATIVSSKTSRYLTNSLKEFLPAFEKEVEKRGIPTNDVVDTEQFKFSEELIAKYFAGIPVRD